MTPEQKLCSLRTQYIDRVVVFNQLCDEMESGFETGMLARVLHISDINERMSDDCYSNWLFNFGEFLQHNEGLMTPNYYDNNMKPTLTWKMSKFYDSVTYNETYYFHLDQVLPFELSKDHT